MTVNEYAKDVHENAVAHGWYDEKISFPEVAAMIHCEISEAIQEYREGKPLIYGCYCDKENKDCSCKPEGLAVELCDAVMRIFDYLAYCGVDIEAVLVAKHEYNIGRPYRHGDKRI